MRKQLLSALLLSAVPIAMFSFAAGAGDTAGSTTKSSVMPVFEVIDSDKDGQISEQEADAVKGLSIKDADQDGDGTLSRSEYDSMVKKMTKG